MIFGQGVMRCHPYLQSMVESIHSEEKDADKTFNKILRKTVGYSVANSLRAFRLGVLPFTAGSKSSLPEVQAYEKAAHQLSAKLAVYADFSLLVLGGKLKQAEMLSARLGDVMSYLYAAMASIKYYEQKVAVADRQAAAPYFHYATRWALQNAEDALHKFLDNFPASMTRKFMRVITMHYTHRMPTISDDLVRELAKAAQMDTAFKAQLTHLVKPCAGDGHDINEQAYKAKMACLDLLAKVKKALRKKEIKAGVRFAQTLDNALAANLISAQEYAQLIDYNKKREKAIRVDEFDFDLNLLDDNAQPIENVQQAS
jgi:acyl-CoA dehydrogenase